MIKIEDFMAIVTEILDENQMEALAKRLKELVPKPTKEVAVKDDFMVDSKSTRRQNAVRAGKNSWIDEGGEKDDIDTLLGNSVNSKNKRTRAKAEPRDTGKIDKVCSVCNKTVKVPRIFASSHYYRCESCIGR